MTKLIQKALIVCLTVASALLFTVCSTAESTNSAYETKSIENYYIANGDKLDGTLLDEYLALVYSGFTVSPDSYLQNREGAELLAADILMNAASGKAADAEKTAKLASMQSEDGSFGSFNDTCLAMIALKTSNTVFSSEKAVKYIISCQDENGFFNISGSDNEDIETAALALEALEPYTASTEVYNCVKKTVERLNEIQNEDGSFADGSCATLAKVTAALSDIGENTNAGIWKKMPELLVTYKNSDGSYRKYVSDTLADPESTAEALCAFHSVASGSSPLKKLMHDGKLSSFELSDIIPFLILYGVTVAGAIAFWIYILTKKKNERTLEEAKKAYELS
jgi:hypothetical protein